MAPRDSTLWDPTIWGPIRQEPVVIQRALDNLGLRQLGPGQLGPVTFWDQLSLLGSLQKIFPVSVPFWKCQHFEIGCNPFTNIIMKIEMYFSGVRLDAGHSTDTK